MAINFRARDTQEAKEQILTFLKRAVRSSKHLDQKVFTAVATPREPRKGQSEILAEDLIRLKFRFASRRLLRVSKPDTALVQGYGPEANAALFA